MGTLSGGDGGGWPPDELPELPPEWGPIVIPDDASELAQEATRVRRELRRKARRQRWRRRLHLPPPKSGYDEEPTTLGVPLLVISIAVIATLTSLFAITWPTRQQPPDLRPTAVASTPVAGTPGGTSVPAGGTGVPSNPSNQPNPGMSAPTSTDTPHALRVPDVPLIDPSGATLLLRGTLPAVVLLVDGCDCSQLVAATAVAAAAVNPTISTVAVGTVQVPSLGDTPATVTAHLRAVVDRGAVLRAAVVPGVGRPSALLVRGNADLVRVVPVVSTVDDFRADLPKLTR
jgi:hypothetical protein